MSPALPRPINQHGPVKDRWRQHHRESRLSVMVRAKGRCEAEDCTEAATEWAHLFSRRHIIGEPWCSSPALTAGLCRSHHNAIDRGLDPALRDRMQWVGVVRLCRDFDAPFSLLTDMTPEGAARAVEDHLTARERAGG